MTDHEKRIQEALACELTGEKWESDGAGVYSVGDSDFELAVCFTQDSGDAAYIAACNPSAIRALLADLDAMRAKAARYDFLRGAHWSNAALCCVLDPKANVRLGAMCPTGENLDCLIDAALKGASA